MSETTVRPFSNGTEYQDWVWANCNACAKRYDEAAATWHCDIERALNEACIGDGRIERAIAERMGATDDSRTLHRTPDGWALTVLGWPCAERAPEDEPTDALLRRLGAPELPL